MNRRTGRATRAVTLIELLIVIAIVAILSAGTLSVITAPMREQVISGMEAAAEAGVSSFYSKLIPDAHAAARLEPLQDPTGLRLTGAAPGGADVVYFVDEGHRLRRFVSEPGIDPPKADSRSGSALLDDVTSLTVEQIPGSPLWRITVQAGREKLGRNMALERSVELGVGSEFFAGGAQ